MGRAGAGGIPAGGPLKLETMKKKISEVGPRLETVLAPHRGIAYDALTDILLDALADVAEVFKSENVEAWEFDRTVCGFRPDVMEKISLCRDAEHLLHWVSGMSEQDRISMLMAFLDWDRVRMNDFRAKYPNSFTKWSAEDDDALMDMFAAGSSWRTLSNHFGRNINAIKLRLQHLGVDLGAEAGRSRFPRRTAIAPAGAAQAAPLAPPAPSAGS